MATNLFDEIDIEISRRIGDPVATAATAGKKLTATERNAYTNKALLKYFNDHWAVLKGNIDLFIAMFPELIVNDQITTDVNGEYNFYDAPVNAIDYAAEVVTNALSASSGDFGSIITETTHNLTADDEGKTIVVWHATENLVVAKIARYIDADNFEITEDLDGTPGSAVHYGVFSPSTTSTGYLQILVDAYNNTDGKDVKILPSTLYLIVKNGINPMYVPSSTNLFGFQLADYFKFLPQLDFNIKSIDVTFIKQPLQEDGSLLAQGGSQDSPFRRHHNSAIAAIGEDLIRIDFQYAK